MDFYDALKNGTTEEELTKAFADALSQAKAKVAADKEREKKRLAVEKAKAEAIARKNKELDNARRVAAQALVPYVGLILDKSITDSITYEKTIVKALKDFEQDFGNIKNLRKFFTEDKNTPSFCTFKISNKDLNNLFLDDFFKKFI